MLALLLLLPAPAMGEESLAPVSRKDLRALAKQFTDRIDRKLTEADLLMSGANELRLKELRSGSVIADGEMLILRGVLGIQRIQLDQEFIAVKEKGRIFLSLADISSGLDFPIDVNPAEGIAQGWFIRENNKFFLDAKKGEVTVLNETTRIAPGDLSVKPDDIFVANALLEKWFGMEIDIDLSSLAVHFRSSTPLPMEEMARRKKNPRYVATDKYVAELPLQKEPYHIYSKPYFDVNTGIFASRPDGNSDLSEAASWSVIGTGDMLGLSMRTFINGGWKNDADSHALSALRLSFSREDATATGLGLPGVRSVYFGDISTLSLPIIGGGRQEQGIYLSNQLKSSATTHSRMDITGDAQPGWDVELYNNENLLGIQVVGADGRYNFESVFLFEGENVMRLAFYGPHGERQEETRRIVSVASTLAAGEGKWETSLTRINKSTYNALDSDTPTEGKPHLVARYERSLGPQSSMNVGVVHRSDFDATRVEEKNYVQAGLATNLLGSLVTADAAYDLDGEYALDALARRSFGKHQTALRVMHSSGAFSQGGGLASFAPENLVEGNIRGPFSDSFMGLSNVTYSGDASYTIDSAAKNFSSRIGLNSRAGNYGFSAGLLYNRAQASAGGGTPSEDRLLGQASVSGSAGRGRWRVSADGRLKPVGLKTLSGDYTFALSDKLEGVADVSHNSDTNLKTVGLGATWKHDKFRLKPRVAFDTNNALSVGVQMNFALYEDAFNKGYSMTSRGVTGSGGVAARVFLDKNGDGIFNDDDELLPDVDVLSLQSASRGVTNKEGVTFLPSLQRSFRTDVVVNAATLPDSYYMPSHEGYSVIPRPGHTSSLDFPMVVGGELDGYVKLTAVKPGNAKVSMRGAKVRLMTPEGRVAKVETVSSDGYYTISGVRPGVYYLAVEKSRGMQSGSVAPEMIVFKPEGSNYFGKDILLAEGDATNFRFSSTNSPPEQENRARILRPEDIAGQAYVINVGAYRSRLALTLAWYRLKLFDPWNGLFSLAQPVDDLTPDARTGLMSLPLKPSRPVTLAQAVRACQAAQSKDYECTVEILTQYRTPKAAPKVPPKVSSAKRPQKS